MYRYDFLNRPSVLIASPFFADKGRVHDLFWVARSLISAYFRAFAVVVFDSLAINHRGRFVCREGDSMCACRVGRLRNARRVDLSFHFFCNDFQRILAVFVGSFRGFVTATSATV